MRKCKIIFRNSKIYYNLLIDEEKNMCSFNNIIKEININSLLEKIENIIINWQPAITNGVVLDGNTLEVYYQDSNDELSQLKFNSLSMPSNAIDLYKLLEALNG